MNKIIPGCLPDKYVFGCKRHLMELTKFVPLDKMNQVCVAQMESKRKPSLITMSSEDVLVQATSAEVAANNKRPKESELISFQMMLKTLLDLAIQKYPPDQQEQQKVFRHIIQYLTGASINKSVYVLNHILIAEFYINSTTLC